MTLKQKLEKNHLLKTFLSFFLFILFKSIRFFKTRKSDKKSIVIISFHKLGDTVFTIPAIKKVLESYPTSCSVYCFAESMEIYIKVFKGIDYYVIDKNDLIYGGRIFNKNARKDFQKLDKDVILDLTGTILSASLIFNIRANMIIGINEIYYKGIYDRFISIRTMPHQTDVYMDAVRGLLKINSFNFEGYNIEVKPTHRILLQPFAGWAAKEWSIDNFIMLYKLLINSYDCKIIFPKSQELAALKEMLRNKEINIIESESIDALIEEIKKSSLFISNDSGPLQIAALFGVPTFCIFGPTNPLFHVPLGEYHRYINLDLDCSPKSKKYCATYAGRYCSDIKCLRLLDVKYVYDGVIKLISDLDTKFNNRTNSTDNA